MAIYHVKSGVNNSDNNHVGTVNTPGDPYGLVAATAAAASGDHIYVWNDGTYNLSTTMAMANSGVFLRGVDNTGTVYTGELSAANRVLVISTTSTILTYSGRQGYVENMTLDMSALGPAWRVVSDAGSGSRFTNCGFAGGGNACVRLASHTEFSFCDFSDNPGTDSSAGGIFAPSATNVDLFMCRFYNHVGGGMVNGRVNAVLCQFFDNGGDGLAPATLYSCVGNLAYNNTGDGFTLPNTAPIYNNSSVANSGYGYNITQVSPDNGAGLLNTFSHNHAHGNTSGSDNISAAGIVTGDPLFANAAGDDFEPSSGSPLINAGLGTGRMHIGPVMPAVGGGGGGSDYTGIIYSGSRRIGI